MQTEIRTQRLTMRRARPADYNGYAELGADYELVKWTASWPWPPERGRFVSLSQPVDPEKGMAGPVFLQGKMIGCAGILHGGELGYMFAPEHWNKGYATEISGALILHCWGRYDWPTITASVFDGNVGSVRVLEKLGFVPTGADTGSCKARGCELPMQNFGLNRPKP